MAPVARQLARLLVALEHRAAAGSRSCATGPRPRRSALRPTRRRAAAEPDARGRSADARSVGRDARAADAPRRRRCRGSASRRRGLAASILFVVSVAAFLYFVLPKLLGLRETWNRIQHGNGWWLGVAALLEVFSFLGYIALFRAVFLRGHPRIGWRASYEITMAGLAATRLFASAGAGGVALTAWALRRSGLEPRIVACRMIAFMALLYAVYMGALVIAGLGLYLEVWPGRRTVRDHRRAGDLRRRGDPDLPRPSRSCRGTLTGWSSAGPMAGGWGGLPSTSRPRPAAAASGVRTAIDLVRSRDPQLLGALAWWGFDIAVLWASFHAFGGSPPTAVVVMSYFVGMVGNTLPLPGGIGGVDGGMIGAFTAFGEPVQLAVVAVLAYRGFAFWLPTLPGAIAYLQLRRTVARWQEDPAAADPGAEVARAGGG